MARKKPDDNKHTFTSLQEGDKELIFTLAREDRNRHFTAEVAAATSDDDGTLYDVRVEALAPVWIDWVAHELKRRIEILYAGKASLLAVPLLE